MEHAEGDASAFDGEASSFNHSASSEAGHDMDSENVDMEAHFAEANYNYFEEEYANPGKEDWDDFEKDYKKFANADWAPADCNDFDEDHANFNDFEEKYRKFAEADCNDFQEEHTYVEEAGCNDFEDENTGFAEAEGLNNKLDEFRKIVDMTFGSEVEAYMFYNKYARDHGFSIRKGKVKVKRAKSSETIRLRHFVCSRAGKRAKKFLAMEGRIRRPRAESCCRCEAKLTIKLDRLRGIWYVGKFVDDHSHPLARPDEIPFLRSHRRIKDFQKAEILAMGAADIRKHQIMDTLERRAFGSIKLWILWNVDVVGMTRLGS
ncbi:uncharacterized protein LOC112268744 [Brachypodium distachyon]|uniref:uncharacterized protein LOC112268744 n=1 Tax=Brachypodium distachyon TaxID=15368 RepID=UPI000D0E25EB|nr:uncharacterized protein LOC112268744 [Brachypodium distachyon]|eukprot:XP_024310579.1 uncharacterized protein LOC112268744 [Brachypodium distachyon]